MPFVEGGIVVDAEPQQQAAPPMAQGGFVQGGIEVDPTPEDSYNKVLQYKAAQTDYVPSKQEFLDYLKVGKEKPIDLKEAAAAFVPGLAHIASLPYKLGEAIGDIYQPPEGVTEGDVAAATFAETAVQSKQKGQSLFRGISTSIIDKLDQLPQLLRSKEDRARVESMLDDIKYADFLEKSDVDRQLALANAPQDQRVPASREVLKAFNIPEEAISQPGLEVGGFATDPSSIAFAGGGKLASMALQAGAAQIPRISAALQRGGENVSAAARMPEEMVGRATTAVTGSERMGQAAQGAVSTGTTGIALGEAVGLPISGTLNIPVVGTASRIIGGTRALGGTMETLGEAGTASGGQSLTPIQRGLLGTGERIAAAEGASAAARALGTAVARSGLEAPIKGAATILLPMVGAGAAGGLLAAISGEEADAISAAIGSGAAFGAFDGGFKLAKSVEANVFNGARVRQTAVDDLNTRPTDVQFTYVDPVNGEQTVTIKDADARATLYGRLNNKQLTKALSEVAGAEGAGIEVIFHTDADTVPGALQTVNYAGVSIGPKNIKSGRPTILINVDRATPEAIPHEILHAKITQDVISQFGSKVIESMIRSEESPNEATKFEKQFTEFATNYAEKIKKSGGAVISDQILTELRDGFDQSLQRAQRIEALKRITDEFAAYYTQEFLKGKDPKTMLPGRIPSFIELALNNAKEAVSERFTRRALQAGFDPVARTFYDANGRRIKLDWMEDAIKNLVTPKEGYEPTEQKVDTSKMTKAQQNAVIMARGYSDLFMTAPDGSIIRPLSKAELAAKTADVANRTMRVVESVPQAERTSISGMDAKGNPVIEGRLSLREADALSQSGIFSPSTSRYIIDIASAIRDGTLMEGKYWKVFGSTGKSGVFGEADKLFLPYGISINSKGGVNVKVVDWGKVQARMYKALTKPAYKNLFRNYDQAMSTLKDVYLKNIAEQNAVPSADALGGGLEGAKKRNFFNEVMGAVPRQGDVMSNLPTAGYVANRKGGSVYQDLRIERIQNAQSTGSNIPWSGDMGEQSSYRRTQLNFQPAETIGETTVSTDQNAGYRILSKNGKFRLYGPDGSTAGIFDTQEQAKLKAEKDYATQARLQPEVDQQQRVPGDEGRQATEAGGRNRAVGGQEGQGQGGAVRQAGDVRFMPAEEDAARKQVAESLPRRASFEAQGVTRDEGGNIFFKGKEPKDWTPTEFEEYGKAFGVPNLGPLSEIANIPSDVAGNPARIPGGLEGKFTYYDLLWLKANPVDVANLPETTHAKLTAKLASTMAPTPGEKVSSFNSIVFGMLSPNAPLLPNEMGQSRLRFGSMEDVRKFADLYPENPTKENLKELNQRLKKELGFISAGKGGLGIAITADISNIVNAARLFTKNPDFFVKKANESWADFVDKLTTQVKGFGTKTGSFGSVWQDPLKASISAMDRHMARIFGQELLGNPELRKRFEGIVVDRFNSMLKKSKEATSAFNRRLKNAEEKGKRIVELNKNDEQTLKKLKAKNDKRIKSIKAEMASTLDSLPDPTATRAKTIDDVLGQAQIYGADRVQKFVNEAVFAAMGSRKATLLAKKGGINPNAPEYIKSVDWVETPKDFQVMSDSYRSALEINERRANELGVAVFPAQWTLWDRIRGRVEPHEVMFPGLEKLPALNDRQLGEAQKANKAAGYGTTPEAGEKWKRRQIDSPSRLAYFMPAGGEKLYEQTAEQSGRRGDRGEGRYSSGNLAPLAGAPQVKGASGPDQSLVGVAEQYAKDNGINLRRQSEYVEVDEDRARRIAQAYDEMPHAPQDPAVREAYQDLIRQTTDQYRALDSAGYKFWFIDINSDAGQQYASSPFNAMRDLRANKSMGVFPTDSGFGTKEDFNPDSNPMLAETGLRWPFGGPNGELRTVYANDLFRAVHDAFGHGIEGSGFRAQGEENAWQAHIRLFTGPARGAITTETRGQNSWLNYGPYGERNRTAKTEDTVFADQKTGLMPEWTWTEGRAADEATTPQGEVGAQRYMPADREVTRSVNINDKTQDFTGQILRGEKVIETRDTLNNAMQGVLGQRIGLTRTGTGDTKVVGYATVAKQPIVYRNESEFRRDQDKHLVEPDSQYDIKKGGVKYGYELTEVTPVEPFAPKSVGRKYSVIEPRYMPATIQREVGRNIDFANPPTDAQAVDALSSEKKAKFGEARKIKPGTQVAARIDIPAFLRTGKYVVAVHKPDGPSGGPGEIIGYDTVTRLQNPKFVVKPGVQRIYEGKANKFPVATVDGQIIADRSIPTDLDTWTAVGMDPKEHSYFYDKRTDQPVTGGSESFSVGNTVFVKNPVYGKPEDFRYMPSPDSAMPGAYSFQGGYRAIPGKTKGSLRLYGPAGSLIGIASSLDEAQRILRRKAKQ
jgi:hypothetical protein